MASAMRTPFLLSVLVFLAASLLSAAIAWPCDIKAGGGRSVPEIFTTNAVLQNAECVTRTCRTTCTKRVEVKRDYAGNVKRRYYCTCHGTQQGDPKFQGFDGSVFYFHGKRETSWCISSDKNLHINAYFSGKPAAVDEMSLATSEANRPHDLTWVQKLAFLFGTHTLVVEAVQGPGWDKALDHLNVVLDGEAITLPPFVRHHDPPAKPWISPAKLSHKVVLTRANTKNQLTVEIEGVASVFIKVVPTNPKTWTRSNSFAHIDAEYTFLNPTSAINGVLGRTLAPAKPKAGGHGDGGAAYILWNLEDYSTSDITAPDCKVSQFSSESGNVDESSDIAGAVVKEPTRISCNGRVGYHGMACR